MDTTNKNRLIKELNKHQLFHFETKNNEIVIDCSAGSMEHCEHVMSKADTQALIERIINLEYKYIDTTCYGTMIVVS
jgi:galactokinase